MKGYQGPAGTGAPANPPSGGSSAGKRDGGPAFPMFFKSPEATSHDGMSLRDRFAGQAMAALVPMLGTDRRALIAEVAYQMADAMLAARAKGAA